MKLEDKWLPWVIKWSEPLVRPQNRHKRLLWKQVQNVRRRRPERSWCLIDPDT